MERCRGLAVVGAPEGRAGVRVGPEREQPLAPPSIRPPVAAQANARSAVDVGVERPRRAATSASIASARSLRAAHPSASSTTSLRVV